MNWDAVGAISEAVGAAGVIVTLAYLANQVRLSRLSTETESIDALSAGWNQINGQLFGEETSNLVVRGFAGLESLSESERYRFMMIGQPTSTTS